MKEEFIARRALTDRQYKSAHDAHCCPTHGCKYSKRDCPVVLGEEQGVRCESCDYEAEHLQELLILLKGHVRLEVTPGHWTDPNRRTVTLWFDQEKICDADFDVVQKREYEG